MDSSDLPPSFEYKVENTYQNVDVQVPLLAQTEDGVILQHKVLGCRIFGPSIVKLSDDTMFGGTIRCVMHGALFKMETGSCLSGPCMDLGLQPLQVHVRNGYVLLDEAVPLRDPN